MGSQVRVPLRVLLDERSDSAREMFQVRPRDASGSLRLYIRLGGN